jgi:hypothetical protein
VVLLQSVGSGQARAKGSSAEKEKTGNQEHTQGLDLYLGDRLTACSVHSYGDYSQTQEHGKLTEEEPEFTDLEGGSSW